CLILPDHARPDRYAPHHALTRLTAASLTPFSGPRFLSGTGETALALPFQARPSLARPLHAVPGGASARPAVPLRCGFIFRQHDLGRQDGLPTLCWRAVGDATQRCRFR